MDEGKERAQGIKERTEEYPHHAKEKVKDMAGAMADKAKEGTNNAAESAKVYAHKTKERPRV